MFMSKYNGLAIQYTRAKACRKNNFEKFLNFTNIFGVLVAYICIFYSSNRPLTSTDWQGRKTIKTYDSYGNTLTETVQSSSGAVKMKTENTYTGGSFLTESKDEVGKTTTFEYDVNSGVMKKGTFPKGQALSYTYDAVNSLKSVSALGNSNSLVYNKGYLVQLTHSGTVYQYTYDGFGRVKKVTADGLTILTNSYTDFGTDIDQVAGAVSKVVSQNGNGDTKTVYLDKYGKTIGVRQGNGALSQEMYDVNNNLIQHIDNDNDIQYNYTYNADGDLKEYTEEQDNEERVKHVIEYDGMDRVEGETYTIGSKTMAYGYEYVEYPEEDVTEITAPFGRVEYTKDTLGRLTKKVVRTGCNKELVTQYTYKASDRSGYTTPYVSIQTVNPVGATYRYEYDANGNITKISTRGGSELASFEYDGLNRLTRENISGQKTVTYMYNAAGNLTEKLVYPYTASGTGLSSGNIQENIAYTYESTWSDRLKSYNGQSISYDSAGNPTSYMGKTVTWSHGRMTGYGTTTYGYNDAGIRIRKGTTEYYVEGTRILAEKRNGTMLYYYYDESGVTAFEYGGQMYYYQKNLQGDVIGICDNCGNVLGTYRYDAWGKILSQGTNNILAVNPFRYRGYYYDTETELYYLQTRYYDPETGRFLSADDISYLDPETINGLNLYAYCGNNPVMNVDPDGTLLWAFYLLLGVLTVAGGIFGGKVYYDKAVAAGKTGADLFWTTFKGILTGAAMGLAVGGAIIMLGAVLVGALSAFGIGAGTILGVSALQAFSVGCLAFNFTAYVVAPILGIPMEGVELDWEPTVVQKPGKTPKHPAIGK